MEVFQPLKGRLRCRGCGRKGRAVVSVKWRQPGPASVPCSMPIASAAAAYIGRCRGPPEGRSGAGLGDITQRRSPRRLGRTGTVHTPSPAQSYAPAVNEMSAAEAGPIARLGIPRYRFGLDRGERALPDPASRFQPEGPHGPSEIVYPWGLRLDRRCVARADARAGGCPSRIAQRC